MASSHRPCLRGVRDQINSNTTPPPPSQPTPRVLPPLLSCTIFHCLHYCNSLKKQPLLTVQIHNIISHTFSLHPCLSASHSALSQRGASQLSPKIARLLLLRLLSECPAERHNEMAKAQPPVPGFGLLTLCGDTLRESGLLCAQQWNLVIPAHIKGSCFVYVLSTAEKAMADMTGQDEL